MAKSSAWHGLITGCFKRHQLKQKRWLSRKTSEIGNQGNLNLRGHQIEFADSVKVLVVAIEYKITTFQQFAAATIRVLQTFGSIEKIDLSNQSMTPHTFKILCKIIIVPRWTYLAFIWDLSELWKFLKLSTLVWARKPVYLFCSLYHPRKKLTERIGNIVPLDNRMGKSGSKPSNQS